MSIGKPHKNKNDIDEWLHEDFQKLDEEVRMQFFDSIKTQENRKKEGLNLDYDLHQLEVFRNNY